MHKKGFFVFLGIFLVMSLAGIIAQHSVSTNNVNIAEDVVSIVNITIVNSGALATDNITQVNISLPSGVVFANGTNTSTAFATFSNTSSVLSWNNATNYLIMNLSNITLTFNVTAANPGNYTINVTSLNNSGLTPYQASFNLSVNDTTAPLVQISSPTNTSYDDAVITVTITNDSSAGYVWWSNGSVNASYTGEVEVVLGDGSHTFTAYVNDSSGNRNSTSITFDVEDNTEPDLSIDGPRNRTYEDSNISLEVSSDSLDVDNDSWKYSLDGGSHNHTFDPSDEVTFDADEGSNELTVYVEDLAGNINSDSIVFHVDTGDDGSSTGGTTASVSTYTASASDLQSGYSRLLKRNDVMKFNVGSEAHTLTVTNVNATHAKITVSSTPQTVTLQPGEQKSIDLNNDSVYDVIVKLEALSTSYAKIMLQSAAGSSGTVGLNASSGNLTANQSGNANTATGSSGSKIFWIVLIIVLAALGVGAYFYLRNGRRYYHRGY